MLFGTVNVIQEGEAVMFYRYDRNLNGYMIAGLIIPPSMQARLDFGKIIRYFLSDIVRDKDIYYSMMPSADNTVLAKLVNYYDTIEGVKIYKVDNSIKEQYSAFNKHLIERANR